MPEWDEFGAEYDFPTFSEQPKIYVIASTPRSGSHYLGHLLQATGLLGSPLEYFHPEKKERLLAETQTATLAEAFKELYSHRTSPNGWFGVKAHPWQFVPMMENAEVREALPVKWFVCIERRDRVAQAISHEIARQTKSWISFNKTDCVPHFSARDIKRAIAMMESQVIQWREYFQSNEIIPITVYYEDLVADPLGEINRILESFGIDRLSRAPAVSIAKQGTQLNDEWRLRYLAEETSLTHKGAVVARRIFADVKALVHNEASRAAFLRPAIQKR
jgi:LPS sulfotransferase NodH